MLFKKIDDGSSPIRAIHVISPPALELWLELAEITTQEFSLAAYAGKTNQKRERKRSELVLGGGKYEAGNAVIDELRDNIRSNADIQRGGRPEDAIEFITIVVGKCTYECAMCYEFERPTTH